MNRIVLRFGDVCTEPEIHAMLAQELSFPAHYGQNLDALYELLTEIGAETLLVIDRPWHARRIDGYVDRVLRVLEDAAGENPHLKVEERRQ